MSTVQQAIFRPWNTAPGLVELIVKGGDIEPISKKLLP